MAMAARALFPANGLIGLRIHQPYGWNRSMSHRELRTETETLW